MRRRASFLFAMLASVGLLLPSAPVVHAHDDGHAPHAHGPADTLHAPLHAHPHPHPHVPSPPSSPSDRGDDSDDGSSRDPHDERAPQSHVHGAASHDAIARLRGSGPSSSASPGVPVSPALVAGAGSSCLRGPLDGGASCHRGAPPPAPDALDRLIRLGRLQV